MLLALLHIKFELINKTYKKVICIYIKDLQVSQKLNWMRAYLLELILKKDFFKSRMTGNKRLGYHSAWSFLCSKVIKRIEIVRWKILSGYQGHEKNVPRTFGYQYDRQLQFEGPQGHNRKCVQKMCTNKKCVQKMCTNKKCVQTKIWRGKNYKSYLYVFAQPLR